MIRALIGVLIAALVAAFIRGLVGMITREVGTMMNPEQRGPGAAGAPNATATAGNPLRKCKVCETYTPGDRMIDGVYCSAACKERAHAA